MTNEIRIIFNDGCIGAGFVDRYVSRCRTMKSGLDNPQFKYVPSYATDLKETFRRVREEVKKKASRCHASGNTHLKQVTE